MKTHLLATANDRHGCLRSAPTLAAWIGRAIWATLAHFTVGTVRRTRRARAVGGSG